MLKGKAANANFVVFDLIDQGSNPGSSTLEEGTLPITPPMRSSFNKEICQLKNASFHMVKTPVIFYCGFLHF